MTTLEDLPTPSARWVPQRKLLVINAVRSGAVSLESVLQRYNMSEEEFKLWEDGLAHAGINGLKVTKFQKLRKKT